jgi:hypothetical protein
LRSTSPSCEWLIPWCRLRKAWGSAIRLRLSRLRLRHAGSVRWLRIASASAPYRRGSPGLQPALQEVALPPSRQHPPNRLRSAGIFCANRMTRSIDFTSSGAENFADSGTPGGIPAAGRIRGPTEKRAGFRSRMSEISLSGFDFSGMAGKCLAAEGCFGLARGRAGSCLRR